MFSAREFVVSGGDLTVDFLMVGGGSGGSGGIGGGGGAGRYGANQSTTN